MRDKKDTSFRFDYEAVKNHALEQLKTGKPLLSNISQIAPITLKYD